MLILDLSLVLVLLSLLSAAMLHAQEVQFTETFHVRSSFDCWRDENGEWTLELGGQGAQVLGIPGESVDYIIPYPLPDELADSKLIVTEASWDPLDSDDPYYGESIAAGDIVDVFLTDDQRLCVRVSTVLDAVIAPEDITQSWQNPPILGLRYIVPVKVTVQGVEPFPETTGEILFSPNSSEQADGSIRGWLNSPLAVQVNYQGDEPFASYQLDGREYSWSERTYVRQMLDMGYSPWAFAGEEEKSALVDRASKFLFSPYRILVEGFGNPRSIPDTSSILLDEETAGVSLSGCVNEYDSLFAGYLLPEADVRGTLTDFSYVVPDYGSYTTAGEPEAICPQVEGTSGLYRLDFTSPDICVDLPEDGWRNEGQQISLQISDNLSGVYSGSLVVEDLSWLAVPEEESTWMGDAYPTEILLDEEGAYRIRVCAEDLAGNVSDEEYGLYSLDFTSPGVSECMLGGVALQEGLEQVPYAETLLLTFTATDALSGFERVEYCFLEEEVSPEETDWQTLSFLDHDDLMQSHELDFEIPVTGMEPSEQWLHIRLEDRAGNVSVQTFGPASLEGIGCFRILSLADPRWEHLFLDEETVGTEILWRGLMTEDFLSLVPKNCIGQEMLPVYRNMDEQGFHPGYALYASFLVNHSDYDQIVVDDHFYRESEVGYEPLDLVSSGEEFQIVTEDSWNRAELVTREVDGANTVILRYRIPPNGLFCDSVGGELTVQDVCDIRGAEKIEEVLVALDITLLKEGVEVCSWLPVQNGQGMSAFWYGYSKRAEEMPEGSIFWLSTDRTAYGDLEKRFP